MSNHNCSSARMGVSRCERAVGETERSIANLKDSLLGNPPNAAAIRQKLDELHHELQRRKQELSNAEAVLAECEAQQIGKE